MARIEHPILSSFIFVHSALDDAGLSANEFRVYAHLARRAGAGAAFPAVASIAEVCRIHKDTAWAVLRSLEERGMVSRMSRAGLPNIYRLATPNAWTHPSDSANGKQGAPETEGRPPPEIKGWGAPETEGHEGTPSKVLHLRESNKAKAPFSSSMFDHMIPARFSLSGRFIDAWHSWVEDRKARRKPITEAGARTQLGKLEREAGSPESACLWIENSIASGYQGLFPPSDRKQPQPSQPQEGGLDYTDRKVWPNGNPANWPKHWIRHPTENRPMRPGEVP